MTALRLSPSGPPVEGGAGPWTLYGGPGNLPYVTTGVPGVLGSGKLRGMFRTNGQSIDLQLFFKTGGTTVLGNGLLIVPLPPGVVVDPSLSSTFPTEGVAAWATTLGANVAPGVLGNVNLGAVGLVVAIFGIVATVLPEYPGLAVPGSILICTMNLPVLP